MKRSEIADEYASGPMPEVGNPSMARSFIRELEETGTVEYIHEPYIRIGSYPWALPLFLFWCYVIWRFWP